jgi:hypoxanthine phosphoribosyltransferase
MRGAPAAGAAHVLVPADALAARVEELALRISSDYAATPDPVVVIGILKGSTIFLADLVRALRIEVAVDFMSISAYAERSESSGIVRIVKDLDGDIGGRDVLVVEDIVDTGLTLNYLRRTLAERAPRSLKTVTLVDKAARRIVPIPVEYVGFTIPDVFVVGYGLDLHGRYRNLPDLLEVSDPARLAGPSWDAVGADVAEPGC